MRTTARGRVVLTSWVLLFAAANVASSTFANTATWLQFPPSSDWNTSANWNPAVVPNSPTATARFATTNRPGIIISADTEVDAATFDPGASGFVISAPATLTLTLSGVGVTNNSQVAQNLRASSGAGNSPSGTLRFINSATAGNNVRITNFAPTTASSFGGGRTVFLNQASAGAALIRNEATSVGLFAPGGSTTFAGSSNAGGAQIMNLGGQSNGAGGGATYFVDSSSAGNAVFSGTGAAPSGAVAITSFTDDSTAQNAVFTNSGSFGRSGLGATTIFSGNSTAAAARLVATGGANLGGGGEILFNGDSTGGTARVELSGNGHLDISGHTSPGVTIGSLASGAAPGDGEVFLGRNTLSVGSNGLSTTFSGFLQDGGLYGGTGGSLSKIGDGTLTLTVFGTYTGGTRVNEGTLLVAYVSGSATGPGPVFVNGVFGGTGRVNGPVAVSSGGVLLGGNGTSAAGVLTLANNLTLHPGAMIEIVLGAAGSHSALARAGGNWLFAQNQEFTILDLGAQPGFYENIITGLATNPGTTANWRIANPGMTGTFTYDGAGNIDLNVTSVSKPGLELTQAVSRLSHGGASSFNVRLPIGGPHSIECRDGNGEFVLVLTFNSTVVSGSAAITGGIGQIATPPTFSGNSMIVRLGGVANAQRLTVSLNNVTNAASQTLPTTEITIGFLVGDINGNGAVNATDIAQVKALSGQILSPANFRADLNASGTVSASDIAQVKALAGSNLP